jgi:hypothetical protein
MLDIFSPLPPEARRENLAAYAQFLAARDGTIDGERRTLSRREGQMVRFEKPLSRVRTMDPKTFAAQYASYDAAKPMTPEMLLLLALVKVNGAEAFGVDRVFEMVRRRALEKNDPVELTLLLEEHYHTRILLSSAVLYGIQLDKPYTPPAAFRALIASIAFGPEVLARPLTLAGEILGTLAFVNLFHKAQEILAHDPELRDSISERICEIMIDEIGHISFNRMRMGAAGLAQTKALLRIVALVLSRAIPEATALGSVAGGTGSDVQALAAGTRLPDEVRRRAFIS